MRSLYTALICFACLLSTSVHSKQPLMFENGYIELPTHIRKQIDSNPNKVKMYFDFNCIFCRAMHPFMVNWGATLPSGLEFEFVPIVINDERYQLNASAFKFVMDSAIPEPQKLRYMDHIYEHIGKTQTLKELARLIKESMSDVGLNVRDFMKMTAQGRFDDYLNKAIEEADVMNLEFTPTFLIGGRYMTHMGLIDGDKEEFIALLNAVTSLHIYTERDKQNDSE